MIGIAIPANPTKIFLDSDFCLLTDDSLIK
jgi:hypothetical protein